MVSCSRVNQPSKPWSSRCCDHPGDVGVTGTQRGVHALGDGLGVGEFPGLHPRGVVGVHVLEVGVGDAVGGGADQLHRIGTADEQVPGVQAQRDRRSVQHPGDLVLVFDHGAHMRVQHRADAALGGGVVQPVKIGAAASSSRRRPILGASHSRPRR